MFVVSNSYRQLFDWAKLRLQERLELRLCLLDVSGLFKCFLQQAGGFKADAEVVRALMISNRKEWRTGETVCRRGETKVAFAAGRRAGNGNDSFCSGERGLTVNTSPRRHSNAEIDVPGFFDKLSGPRGEFRIVAIISDHRP